MDTSVQSMCPARNPLRHKGLAAFWTHGHIAGGNPLLWAVHVEILVVGSGPAHSGSSLFQFKLSVLSVHVSKTLRTQGIALGHKPDTRPLPTARGTTAAMHVFGQPPVTSSCTRPPV